MGRSDGHARLCVMKWRHPQEETRARTSPEPSSSALRQADKELRIYKYDAVRYERRLDGLAPMLAFWQCLGLTEPGPRNDHSRISLVLSPQSNTDERGTVGASKISQSDGSVPTTSAPVHASQRAHLKEHATAAGAPATPASLLHSVAGVGGVA